MAAGGIDLSSGNNYFVNMNGFSDDSYSDGDVLYLNVADLENGIQNANFVRQYQWNEVEMTVNMVVIWSREYFSQSHLRAA